MQEFNLDEIAKLAGKSFVYEVRGARFNVTVVNVRIRYGNLDLLVKPASGSGSFWVSKTTLKEANQPTCETSEEVAEAEKELAF